jgi:ADP-ribose pyrophosphatase YjhB (NUDIX family)
MSPSRPARFCPQCATRLVRRDDHGVARPTCPSCGFIAYRNPSPAVATIIPHESGVVLVRRRFEPYAGSWSLPSGFMEYAEEPIQAAIRETREETGLRVETEELIGAYSGTDDPRVRVVLLVYRARIIGGRMQAGDDADDIGTFGLDALPPAMAFRAHRLALRDFSRSRARAESVARRTIPATRAGDSRDRRASARSRPRSKLRT